MFEIKKSFPSKIIMKNLKRYKKDKKKSPRSFGEVETVHLLLLGKLVETVDSINHRHIRQSGRGAAWVLWLRLRLHSLLNKSKRKSI